MHYTCTVAECDAEKDEDIAIDPTAHKAYNVDEVPATCNKEGVAAGEKCEYCQAELSGFAVIPADPALHVNAMASEGKYCSADVPCDICGTIFTNPNPAEHTYQENGVCKYCWAVCAHNFVDTVCTICGKKE
jgi:hypothetical protein